MGIKELFFAFVISTSTHGDENVQTLTPTRTGSISERIVEIKRLIEAGYTIENQYSRRLDMIREIIAISNSHTPGAAAALIDLMLHEEIDAIDEPYTGRHASDKIAYQIANCLLKFPFTSSPSIQLTQVPNSPFFKQSDPQRLKSAIRDYYSIFPDRAITECRAWCQEVREGKRTFQLTGSKIRYNHLGKPAIAPPPRIHSQNPPRTETKAPQTIPHKKHPATNWLIGLCALAILFGVIKLANSR
jgi:hypothetical protein